MQERTPLIRYSLVWVGVFKIRAFRSTLSLHTSATSVISIQDRGKRVLWWSIWLISTTKSDKINDIDKQNGGVTPRRLLKPNHSIFITFPGVIQINLVTFLWTAVRADTSEMIHISSLRLAPISFMAWNNILWNEPRVRNATHKCSWNWWVGCDCEPVGNSFK